MPKTMYSWNTRKVENGYEGNVNEVVSRDTPNEEGRYADTYTVATFIEKTRERAKTSAQREVRLRKRLAAVGNDYLSTTPVKKRRERSEKRILGAGLRPYQQAVVNHIREYGGDAGALLPPGAGKHLVNKALDVD